MRTLALNARVFLGGDKRGSRHRKKKPTAAEKKQEAEARMLVPTSLSVGLVKRSAATERYEHGRSIEELQTKEQTLKRKASIRMQAYWRGYLARRHVHRMLAAPVSMLFVLGGPGSGKSAIASFAAAAVGHLRAVHISIGKLLRVSCFRSVSGGCCQHTLRLKTKNCNLQSLSFSTHQGGELSPCAVSVEPSSCAVSRTGRTDRQPCERRPCERQLKGRPEGRVSQLSTDGDDRREIFLLSLNFRNTQHVATACGAHVPRHATTLLLQALFANHAFVVWCEHVHESGGRGGLVQLLDTGVLGVRNRGNQGKSGQDAASLFASQHAHAVAKHD